MVQSGFPLASAPFQIPCSFHSTMFSLESACPSWVINKLMYSQVTSCLSPILLKYGFFLLMCACLQVTGKNVSYVSGFFFISKVKAKAFLFSQWMWRCISECKGDFLCNSASSEVTWPVMSEEVAEEDAGAEGESHAWPAASAAALVQFEGTLKACITVLNP